MSTLTQPNISSRCALICMGSLRKRTSLATFRPNDVPGSMSKCVIPEDMLQSVMVSISKLQNIIDRSEDWNLDGTLCLGGITNVRTKQDVYLENSSEKYVSKSNTLLDWNVFIIQFLLINGNGFPSVKNWYEKGFPSFSTYSGGLSIGWKTRESLTTDFW